MTASKRILIVEDSENDQLFLRRAFESSDVASQLDFVKDAEEAIDYLKSNSEPSAILTDLNMPGIGGEGLLDYLEETSAYKRVPTVVFSSSDDPNDIEKCYRKNAWSYVVKPFGMKEYRRFAQAFQQYWLEYNHVPQRTH